MKDLYILGAGGCGRELLSMLLDNERIRGKHWNIKGFLDDTNPDIGEIAREYPVVSGISDYLPQQNDVFMMGLARPQDKEKVASIIKTRGGVFVSFIHHYAALGHYNKIGEGALIYGGFGMTVNVKIGSFVTLQACYLGHDVQISDFATVSSFCNIMGNARLGTGCFLGSNVAVAPKINVGDWAYACVGSVLIRNVADNRKVMGNPARTIG